MQVPHKKAHWVTVTAIDSVTRRDEQEAFARVTVRIFGVTRALYAVRRWSKMEMESHDQQTQELDRCRCCLKCMTCV